MADCNSQHKELRRMLQLKDLTIKQLEHLLYKSEQVGKLQQDFMRALEDYRQASDQQAKEAIADDIPAPEPAVPATQ